MFQEENPPPSLSNNDENKQIEMEEARESAEEVAVRDVLVAHQFNNVWMISPPYRDGQYWSVKRAYDPKTKTYVAVDVYGIIYTIVNYRENLTFFCFHRVVDGHYTRTKKESAFEDIVVMPGLKGVLRRNTYSVYPLALLTALRQQFKSPLVNEAQTNAVTAYLQKVAGSLSPATRHEVSRLFMAEKIVVNESNRFSTQRVHLDQEERELVLQLTQQCDIGEFRKVYAVECPLDYDTTDNGQFEIVSSKGFQPNANTGIRGEFRTQPINKPARWYRSHGFTFSGTGGTFTQYDTSPKNICLAMARLYKARPDEEQLRENQAALAQIVPLDIQQLCSRTLLPKPPRVPPEIAEVSKGLDIFLDVVAESKAPPLLVSTTIDVIALILYPIELIMYLFVAVIARQHHVNVSVKRKLYQRWYDSFDYHSYDERVKGPVEAKIKNELAKPGKFARLFVSFGSSILYAGWCHSVIKEALCKVFVLNGVGANQPGYFTVYFPLTLRIFKSLGQHPPMECSLPGMYVDIFSDDGSVCIVDTDLRKYYLEVDISSCDSGNSWAMFAILGKLMTKLGFGCYIKNLFKRLFDPITIRNPFKRAEFVKIIPKHIFQGSGCPETTIVNNVASSAIYISMYRRVLQMIDDGSLHDNVLSGAFETKLQLAAKLVGHKVTIDIKHNRSEMQFLKHTTYSTKKGTLVDALNLGPVMRSLGSVDGDLDHIKLSTTKKAFRAMTWEERFEKRVAGVVAGLKNEPGNIILDALRKRFREGVEINDRFQMNHTNRSHEYITTSQLQERYGGTRVEWENLASKIAKIKYGSEITDSVLASIYEVDYGLR